MAEELQGNGFLSEPELQQKLELCFKHTRRNMDTLPQHKNYFAMSMKNFFVSLANNEDMLELMCHNWADQWINKGASVQQSISSRFKEGTNKHKF